LLELFADVDVCVRDNFGVEVIDERAGDGVLEDYKAIAVVVVEALLDGFEAGDA
jgi:hypothetical protein